MTRVHYFQNPAFHLQRDCICVLPTSNSSAILYAGFPESNNLIASTFSFSAKSFTFRITGSHHVNFT
jgi:hypothetical protein